nr:MAG TPA: hypothetical protein [Caudoviricetes sp.]
METPKFCIINIIFVYNKRAVWARSPDEGCVNRLYRATHQYIG